MVPNRFLHVKFANKDFICLIENAYKGQYLLISMDVMWSMIQVIDVLLVLKIIFYQQIEKNVFQY